MNGGNEFLTGIIVATFAASGVFFLKFWRASRDRFFLLLCITYWLLAFERIVLAFLYQFDRPENLPMTETNVWIYLIRLSAFVVILVAVIDRNRRAAQG